MGCDTHGTKLASPVYIFIAQLVLLISYFLQLKSRVLMTPLAISPPRSTPEPDVSSIPQDAATVPTSTTSQALTGNQLQVLLGQGGMRNHVLSRTGRADGRRGVCVQIRLASSEKEQPRVRFRGHGGSIALERQTSTSSAHPIGCVTVTKLNPRVDMKHLLQLWAEEGWRHQRLAVGRVTNTWTPVPCHSSRAACF